MEELEHFVAESAPKASHRPWRRLTARHPEPRSLHQTWDPVHEFGANTLDELICHLGRFALNEGVSTVEMRQAVVSPSHSSPDRMCPVLLVVRTPITLIKVKCIKCRHQKEEPCFSSGNSLRLRESLLLGSEFIRRPGAEDKELLLLPEFSSSRLKFLIRIVLGGLVMVSDRASRAGAPSGPGVGSRVVPRELHSTCSRKCLTG